MENYKMVSSYARESTIQDGSSIFVTKTSDYVEVIGLKQQNLEGQVESSNTVSKANKMVIICVYRPPTGNISRYFF